MRTNICFERGLFSKYIGVVRYAAQVEIGEPVKDANAPATLAGAQGVGALSDASLIQRWFDKS